MPFEEGHTLATGRPPKSKSWTNAIERAIKRRDSGKDPQALEKLAEVLLQKCDQGDIAALKELGDRIEGKAQQFLEVNKDDPFEGLSVEDVANLRSAITLLLASSRQATGKDAGEKEAGTLSAIQQATGIP